MLRLLPNLYLSWFRNNKPTLDKSCSIIHFKKYCHNTSGVRLWPGDNKPTIHFDAGDLLILQYTDKHRAAHLGFPQPFASFFMPSGRCDTNPPEKWVLW